MIPNPTTTRNFLEDAGSKQMPQKRQIDLPLLPDPGVHGPLSWQKILAERAELPVQCYYAELLSPVPGTRRSSCCVAWPVSEPSISERSPWGENEGFIEGWFETGEALAESAVELQIDEPNRWERAVSWVRTLAAAAGILTLS
jgi:hypothetical protein